MSKSSGIGAIAKDVGIVNKIQNVTFNFRLYAPKYIYIYNIFLYILFILLHTTDELLNNNLNIMCKCLTIVYNNLFYKIIKIL